jgi:hypothetical protein
MASASEIVKDSVPYQSLVCSIGKMMHTMRKIALDVVHGYPLPTKNRDLFAA